jgi:hypothetical protein
MQNHICRHIRYNGVRCGSPALRDKHFCYYHHTFHTKHEPLNPAIDPALLERECTTAEALRHPVLAEYHGYKPKTPIMLNLPVLEDRDSVLLAISMVVTALGEYRMQPNHANSILFGLQLALSNLGRYQPGETAEKTPVTETELGSDGLAIAA